MNSSRGRPAAASSTEGADAVGGWLGPVRRCFRHGFLAGAHAFVFAQEPLVQLPGCGDARVELGESASASGGEPIRAARGPDIGLDPVRGDRPLLVERAKHPRGRTRVNAETKLVEPFAQCAAVAIAIAQQQQQPRRQQRSGLGGRHDLCVPTQTSFTRATTVRGRRTSVLGSGFVALPKEDGITLERRIASAPGREAGCRIQPDVDPGRDDVSVELEVKPDQVAYPGGDGHRITPDSVTASDGVIVLVSHSGV